MSNEDFYSIRGFELNELNTIIISLTNIIVNNCPDWREFAEQKQQRADVITYNFVRKRRQKRKVSSS